MNWDQIGGHSKEFRDRAKKKWRQLAFEKLDLAAGRRDQVIGRLHGIYDWQRDRAERELDALNYTS